MLHHTEDAMAAHARSKQRLLDFVADTSHELCAPLTSTRGYGQLQRQGVLTERTGPRAAPGRGGSDRMAALVDDLLYRTRLDAQSALRHKPLNLPAVVRDSAADALAVQLGRPTELQVPELCVVRGDEDALRQVMANLLANVRAHLTDGPSNSRARRSSIT